MGDRGLQVIPPVHSEAAGHLGVRKTIEQVRRRACWKGWRGDVCCHYQQGAAHRQGKIHDMVVGAPWEGVGMDKHPASDVVTIKFSRT